MVKDTRRLRATLAGLIILVILVSLTASLSMWKPSISKQNIVVEEQSPEVSGRLLVYVNNRLAYSGQVHSFLKPVTPMLAVGLFPTTGFQSISVNFYNERPSTWIPASSAGSMSNTLYSASTGFASFYTVWGMSSNIAPLLLVYDTVGNKWTEISISTTPSITVNSTGVLLSISGSITPSISSSTNVSMIRLVRPTNNDGSPPSLYAVRMMEDTISPVVTVNPGDSLTVVYQFYFKSNQVFTENWARVFFAWLCNVPGAKTSVKVTDGSTDYIDPSASASSYPVNNAPVDTYIVVGNGSASFNRTAYKVVSEVTRAEPSIQTYGGGVSLSYAFTFSKDTTITEVAVYSKLKDGKEIMLLYYVLPQPVTVKAGTPFSVTFYINLPYQDRV